MDNRLFLRFLIVFGCFATTSFLPIKSRLNRQRLLVNGRPWHGLKPSKYHEKSNTNAAPVQWFYQKTDHFDPKNDDYYWQRYWNNTSFYKSGGPAFLMIGGESTETAWWVEDETIQWLKLAKEHSALAFLLEHRFYGSSQPKTDMSTNSLGYLSSEQAIEDIVYFIQQINYKLNLTNTKWILFGGSYSGALAAWTRAKHPDIVYAAVASSAPVQPIVDFKGYLEIVEDGLNNFHPNCGKSLHEGLVAAHGLIKSSSGRQQVFKGFRLCEYLDYADQEQISYFFLQIIGLYMTVVQYSGDNVLDYNKNINIPSICAFHLQDNKTDLEKLQDVNQFFMQYYQESCLYINFEDYIQYLQQAGDDKAWVYQTCNEFGYYQSTTSTKTNQFFGDVLPVDWYIRQCELIYGFKFSNGTIYNNVNKTNSIYHGQKYNATRVVLPNGTKDPWHLPAILTSPNNESFAIVINGTSHVADIYPDADNDSDAIKEARSEIAKHVRDWVKN